MSHRATIKRLVLILIHFYFKNLYVLKKCRYEIFCFIDFSRHKPANGRLSKIRSENIPQSIVSCFVKSFIPLNFAENDFPQIRYQERHIGDASIPQLKYRQRLKFRYVNHFLLFN